MVDVKAKAIVAVVAIPIVVKDGDVNAESVVVVVVMVVVVVVAAAEVMLETVMMEV